MKVIISRFIYIFFIFASSKGYSDSQNPRLLIKKTIIPVECYVESKVNLTITVENLSTSSIKIQDIQASCSCIKVLLCKYEVAPKEVKIIKLEYTNGKSDGVFRKYLLIVTDNGEKSYNVTLLIHSKHKNL